MRFFGKGGNFLGRSNSRASLLWEYALGHRSGNVVCGIVVNEEPLVPEFLRQSKGDLIVQLLIYH